MLRQMLLDMEVRQPLLLITVGEFFRSNGDRIETTYVELSHE